MAAAPLEASKPPEGSAVAEELKGLKGGSAVADRVAVMKDKAAAMKTAASTLKQAAKNKLHIGGEQAEVSKEEKKETLVVSQAFAHWLTGGAQRNKDTQAKTGHERQTVLRTVEKFSGVAKIQLDPSPASNGKKKILIIGEDEARQKAKTMMQDLALRCNQDSLEHMAESWGGETCETDPLANSLENMHVRSTFAGVPHQVLTPAGELIGSAGANGYKNPYDEDTNALSLAALRRSLAADTPRKRRSKKLQEEKNQHTGHMQEEELYTEETDLVQQGVNVLTEHSSAAYTKLLIGYVHDLREALKPENTSREGASYAMRKYRFHHGAEVSVDDCSDTCMSQVDEVLVILEQMHNLPVSEHGLVGSGAYALLNDESVRKHPDPRVCSAVEDLLFHWKEFLAYSPGGRFDHTLNSYLAHSISMFAGDKH
jgi:hypothetical protein